MEHRVFPHTGPRETKSYHNISHRRVVNGSALAISVQFLIDNRSTRELSSQPIGLIGSSAERSWVQRTERLHGQLTLGGHVDAHCHGSCKGSLCEQTEASTESSILPSDECFEQHRENVKYYLNLLGDILIPLLKRRHILLHENSLQNKILINMSQETQTCP